jgi:hypothetical protein
LDTRVHTLLSPSGNSNPIAIPWTSLVIDEARNRALQTGFRQLMSVDLSTGERMPLSSKETSDGGTQLNNPRDIAIDTANDRALVVDTALRAIYVVDLPSGERAILSR